VVASTLPLRATATEIHDALAVASGSRPTSTSDKRVMTPPWPTDRLGNDGSTSAYATAWVDEVACPPNGAAASVPPTTGDTLEYEMAASTPPPAVVGPPPPPTPLSSTTHA